MQKGKTGCGRLFGRGLVFICLVIVCLLPAVSEGGETSYLIKEKVGDFEPEVKIYVCWRKAKAGNPFLVEGPFNCETAITTVDAPFPGGGVTGEQLMSVVDKVVVKDSIIEVRIRALEAGKSADDPGAGMMTVDRDANEFYNNYVGRDARGRLVLFLDIETKAD
jgi:hypothetical protein